MMFTASAVQTSQLTRPRQDNAAVTSLVTGTQAHPCFKDTQVSPNLQTTGLHEHDAGADTRAQVVRGTSRLLVARPVRPAC